MTQPENLAAIERAMRLLRPRAIHLLRELVRIPSVNHPPTGDEKEVQLFYADLLRSIGMDVEAFEPNDVPSFADHPACLVEHDMRDRPNVVGRIAGQGEGRSLMLIAHADVEAPGKPESWTGGDPFSGDERDGRVYGRGAADDKSGMMLNAMVPLILKEAGFALEGDLAVASVCDEEQAGSNGVVALICRGRHSDGAIYTDGCNQDICIANLGGGCCNIHFQAGEGAVDTGGLVDFLVQLKYEVRRFADARQRTFKAHPLFGHEDFARLAVRLAEAEIGAEDFSRGNAKIWLYLLPGEKEEDLKREFEASLQELAKWGRFDIHWQRRFVSPSMVAVDHPLVESMARAFEEATGRQGRISGALMCDMGFVNVHGGLPCLMFAASRFGGEGSVHAPDEFVVVDELMECLKTLVLCAMDWCGARRISRLETADGNAR